MELPFLKKIHNSDIGPSKLRQMTNYEKLVRRESFQNKKKLSFSDGSSDSDKFITSLACIYNKIADDKKQLECLTNKLLNIKITEKRIILAINLMDRKILQQVKAIICF